ncbi:MAG: hypothetical protein VW931_06315 [Alphaproteobacteria bacterium]
MNTAGHNVLSAGQVQGHAAVAQIRKEARYEAADNPVADRTDGVRVMGRGVSFREL